MFKNYVSLGGACDVAKGLKKYYLRSQSGPFDWLVSPFEGVIDCIENQFEDFLVRENLDLDLENKRHFKDRKYDFTYLHDVKNNLDEEYFEIKTKYNRRIEKFKQSIIEPTCFIRRLRNVKEIEFILKNREHIEEVIMQSNSANKLIFILPKSFKSYAEGLDSYYVGEPWNKMKAEDLSNIFDTSPELLSYLLSNADPDIIINNILYSHSGYENRLMYASTLISSYFNELVVKKRKIDIETDKKYILISGGGIFGRLFYEMTHEQEKICLFIDSESRASQYMGHPILKAHEAMLYIEKLGINKKDILAVIVEVWKWDEMRKELNNIGINDCVPLSFILQKSLGIWPEEQKFKP